MFPSESPSRFPSNNPTISPSLSPTVTPSNLPTVSPTNFNAKTENIGIGKLEVIILILSIFIVVAMMIICILCIQRNRTKNRHPKQLINSIQSSTQIKSEIELPTANITTNDQESEGQAIDKKIELTMPDGTTNNIETSKGSNASEDMYDPVGNQTTDIGEHESSSDINTTTTKGNDF